MASKTLGTILIAIICVLLFPVMIGLIGGAFGIVFGVFGAIFGVIFGVIGGIFGAIFGMIGGIFDFLFDWDYDFWPDFGFFDFNIFAVAAIVLLVVALTRNKTNR